MTLIITAICKNGICICADKRNKRTYSDGRVKITDDQYKIYKFQEIPIIIFNHGINEIKSKPWNVFCSEYEKLETWRNKSFQDIVEDFKNFIKNDVVSEVHNNTASNSLGFVLCGKTFYDDTFKAYELHWGPQFNGIPHDGIIRSGDGSKYLKKFFDNNPQINSIDYWRNKDISQAEDEVRNLFNHAIQEKENLHGEEFSNDFDIAFINNSLKEA